MREGSTKGMREDMTSKKIIINSNSYETRIALVEDSRLSELYIEECEKIGIVSNVYKGVVSRILPGMNSAFINIGLSKTGFLFGGDVLDVSAIQLFDESNLDHTDAKPKNSTPIEKILSEGQHIIVQVAKEALGSKGPRLTQVVTVPGRNLVLLPNFRHVGISRRIEAGPERDRLRQIVCSLERENLGVIVRTAAVGADEEQLKDDLAQLIQTWKGVQHGMSHVEAPGILYQDLKLSQKLIRDIYSEDVTEILCDDLDSFLGLKEFLNQNIPSAARKLKHYIGTKPIFDEFGLELDLARALSGRVALPSGGYLILEQTEALTSVDVNTGKFVGRQNARSTILQTNLEATVLLVEQLRVRNIGGIIIVDFIDMEDPVDREIIYNKLLEELKKDRARTNVLRISELGLVQMTRKRTSESLERRFMEPCPRCDGSGSVKTSKFEALELIREIVRISLLHSKMDIQVKARKDIIHSIQNELSDVFKILVLDKKIQVHFEPGFLSNEDLRQPVFDVN